MSLGLFLRPPTLVCSKHEQSLINPYPDEISKPGGGSVSQNQPAEKGVDILSVFIWIVVIACFVLAFVGLVYPVIPGALLLWAGFFIYYFFIDGSDLTVFFWVLEGLFTAFLFVVDFVANSYFLKKYGSTKWGERIGAVSIIAGSFFFPPLGLLVVPFFSVFVTELLQKKTATEAAKVALAAIVGFISSTVAKAVIQILMVALFVFYWAV